MPPQAGQLHLLDLSEDLLYRICCQLPFCERLRLAGVCRKWRQLCAVPSEMWRKVEAHPVLNEAELLTVNRFAEWLSARAAAVEELTFRFAPVAVPHGTHVLLPLQRSGSLPLLRRLSISWESLLIHCFILCAEDLPTLPSLSSLDIHVTGVLLVRQERHAYSALAPAYPQLETFSVYDTNLMGLLGSPWLPPSLTKLSLSNCRLEGLPGVLAHLPKLRSLTVDRNGALSPGSFSMLTHLSALEDLNLSENQLSNFPAQISLLTNLRILYLHRCFGDQTVLNAACWAALKPLTRLSFLSISGNQLAELPAEVGAMTQLQALHLEENAFPSLAPAAVWGNLRELLLDWQSAMLSPAMLAACTQLTRLMLCNHCVTWEGEAAALLHVPHGAIADAFVSTLARLPALKLLQDVLPPSALMVMTAPVGRAMWQLPRACPNVEIQMLEGTYVGWTLEDLERREQPPAA